MEGKSSKVFLRFFFKLNNILIETTEALSPVSHDQKQSLATRPSGGFTNSNRDQRLIGTHVPPSCHIKISITQINQQNYLFIIYFLFRHFLWSNMQIYFPDKISCSSPLLKTYRPHKPALPLIYSLFSNTLFFFQNLQRIFFNVELYFNNQPLQILKLSNIAT